jgi:parvulin-like peptidyl-prolyl isomerase
MKSVLGYIIIILSLLFPVFAIAQSESEVLAKIGSDKITVEEFQNRFDFMPHLNYSDSNIDSIKKEFLYSLIAEKLWALEADELQLDTVETIRLSLQSLKDLFVKDELFKQEVQSKIVITRDEISKGLSRVNRILSTLILASPDSEKIWNLYNAFQNGAKFDSVLIALGMPQKPFEVKYGSFEDEVMEEILFTLKLNEISKPIKSKNNWYIFKLIDDEQDKSIDQSKDHAKNIVIKKLQDRKSQKIGQEFLDNLLVGKSIIADRQLFDLLSDKLLTILKDRTGKSKSDSLIDIQLLEDDIIKTIASLNQTDLNADFIKLSKTPATIKDFLYYAIYQKIIFNSFTANRFNKTLNMVIKKFIEDQIITREGYIRGLDKLPSVKKDLDIWKNYYLSEFFMNSYADSIKITDSEVENFLRQENNLSKDILQVNIIEILTDKLDNCENILDELNRGTDFNELASAYNKREWTKQSNGEWGYFNSSIGGEIGIIASGLEVGQVYGPLKVPEGYSIFKLIGKRTNSQKHSILTDKDSLKLIRIKIALSKMNNLINDKTVSFATRYKISINEQLLETLEVSGLNTFTYRLIGFGGKIAAFPITIPMYEWYKEYQLRKEIP